MRTQPAGLGSHSDRGGAVECVFRFLPECAWRLADAFAACAAQLAPLDALPNPRFGVVGRVFSSHACKPPSTASRASAHLRYGGGAKRAATNLSNFARAEGTHCRLLFSESSMSVAIVLTALDAMLKKLPGEVANKNSCLGKWNKTWKAACSLNPFVGPCRVPAS